MPISNDPADRAAINRASSVHSARTRTEAGKQRTRLNALRHGLNPGHMMRQSLPRHSPLPAEVGFVFPKSHVRPHHPRAHDASITSASLSAPAEDGFVFSAEEIETYSRHEDRAGQANRQDLYGYAWVQPETGNQKLETVLEAPKGVKSI